MNHKAKAKRNEKPCTCDRNEEHARVRTEIRKLDGKVAHYGAWDDPEVERTNVVGERADGSQRKHRKRAWKRVLLRPGDHQNAMDREVGESQGRRNLHAQEYARRRRATALQ